ncbi:MAG: DUF4224 domain-containing protein [Lysobacterales bacterium]
MPRLLLCFHQVFLTEKQVERLSGRKYSSAQARQFRRMGISYRINGANQVVVLESDVISVERAGGKDFAPNYEALDAIAQKKKK